MRILSLSSNPSGIERAAWKDFEHSDGMSIWGKRDDMIVHQTEPYNAEPPPGALVDPITPLDTFYARNHAPIPRMDRASWRLRVDGMVDRPWNCRWTNCGTASPNGRCSPLCSARATAAPTSWSSATYPARSPGVPELSPRHGGPG